MSGRYGERTALAGAGHQARVSQWGQRALVKSIQRGTITLNNVTSATATITAVDPNRTICVYHGNSDGSTSVTPATLLMRVELTNPTTVTGFINTANAVPHVISYDVIEFWPGVLKSLQRGTATGTTATISATITAVADLTRTTFHWGGATSTSTATMQSDTVLTRALLLNTTTVNGVYANTSGTNWTMGFQVAEWY